MDILFCYKYFDEEDGHKEHKETQRSRLYVLCVSFVNFEFLFKQ